MIFRGTIVSLTIVCALPAQTSRVIRPDVSRFPGKPWVAHGGEWATREDALHARGGEEPKLAVEGLRLTDFQLDVELRATAGAQAGVVFRGNDLEEGRDGFRGYYAGIDASNGQLVWGANDPSWRRIASQPAGVEADTWYRLRLQVADGTVKVFVNEKPISADAWPVFDGVDAAFER